MQDIRILLRSCFTFRGTISPKLYVTGWFIVTLAGFWLFLCTPMIGDGIVSCVVPAPVNGMSIEERRALYDEQQTVRQICMLLYVLPLFPQLSLAACRLRDAERSMYYLLIPLGVFFAAIGLGALVVWEELNYVDTNRDLTGGQMRGIGMGVLFFAVIFGCAAICITQLIFLWFGRLWRKEIPVETTEGI